MPSPGQPAGVARIVAPRNGTCSAQVALRAGRELKGPRATVGDFRGPGGAKLPASIARAYWPVGHPEWEMRSVGEGKGAGAEARPGPTRGNAMVMLDRHSPIAGLAGPLPADKDAAETRGRLREKELKRIEFFDHLSARPPTSLPARSCQPLWISVTVPHDAAPGTYRSSVRIEAGGAPAVELPLELAVLGWRVPEAKDFQAIMALEQSPYAVARHYKVTPWSEAHFRLMAKSVGLLGRVGNDFLAVPVVQRTEFGNSADSPLRIIRRRDGSLSFDFALVDRYLDLAVSHWGRPWCVCFVVDHCGRTKHRPAIGVLDEATGRAERVEIGPEAPPEPRRAIWRVLATAIRDHMVSRGLAGSLHWGLHGDGVNDPTLPRLLRQFTPAVRWARFSHQYRPDDTYAFCANVRGGYFLPATSRKGWKALTGRINLWLPRHWNSIGNCEGKSAPAAYRLGIQRSIVSGSPGQARTGADYWDATWLHDFGLHPYTGMPILSVFWPGPDGAETSARYEMLCEGLQEAEARIFLEQAAEKLGDARLTERITALLDGRIRDTLFAPVSAPHVKIEEYSSGWQVRSRALYAMAAEVAGRVGVDLARNELKVAVPARGRRKLNVKLRNWSGRPRAWKLRCEHDWLRPARPAGTARGGSQVLEITLDAADLKPGEPATGTVVLTDAATGRSETLQITALVSKVFDLTGPARVANIDCGGEDRLHFTLLNGSGGELRWRADCPAGWVEVQPARGRLPAGGQCPVTVVLRPADVERATHRLGLMIAEAGGAKRREPLVVHVLPRRRARTARPPGQALPMQQLPEELAKSFIRAGRPRKLKYGVPFYRPDPRRPLRAGRKTLKDWNSFRKEFKAGLCLGSASELTYSLQGQHFRAFSAEVGWRSSSRIDPECREVPRLHFEIYVDGRLADHSGLMDLTDPPRLLVAGGLKGAKQIRLVTRLHHDGLEGRGTRVEGVWGEPLFHK